MIDQEEEELYLKDGFVQAGVVGVDSGQVMICDPCYIDSQWKRDSECPDRRPMRLTHKGRMKWPGKGKKTWVYPKDFGNYEAPIAELGKMSVNAMREMGLLEEKPNPPPSGEFSYTGCCESTLAEPKFGQLKYQMGHAGAGVVMSSGLGDGCYKVYVKKATLKDWGERIVEARIVFVPHSVLGGEAND